MSFRILTEQTGIFESAVSIGVLKMESGFAFIDSGVEDSAVKKALQSIGDGWGAFKAILNTHAHADHIGGNAWSIRNRGVKTYGPEGEAHYIEHPDLEPHFLFGCAPIPELMNKFYCAKASDVHHRLRPGSFELEDRKLNLIDLKGHSPGMLGVITEEGLFHVADAIMPESLVTKHKLMFVHNLGEHLETLERVAGLAASGYLLSHGGYLEKVDTLIDLNRSVLLEVNDLIFTLAAEGAEDTTIHAGLCQRLGMVENPGQYYLNHTAVRAHLKYLKDLGKLDLIWDQGRLLWVPVSA
ncbi:MBL fold metallo-hydrolase [Acidaminobacter sp.]|uniref:MBL fold metallo-hydrolase n=1 Tax=Acidaminobacter sp. TaxID=1872102 RepID=UPI0025637A48|nr:MBL fold metallo-hydrolase [Acidaminobacter sp.]MDK9709755.1 MBL fold metallo-hydrolase [Acidaminobacter sp.]